MRRPDFGSVYTRYGIWQYVRELLAGGFWAATVLAAIALAFLLPPNC